MNKKELVDAMYDILDKDLTKKDINKAVDAFCEAVVQGLQEDGKVGLVGFGSWLSKTRSSRIGRNPKTGSPVEIPETIIAKFLPGINIKEALNN